MEQSNQTVAQSVRKKLENSIKTRVIAATGLAKELADLFLSEYKLDTPTAVKIIDTYIKPYIDHLVEGLYIAIETPYVDKMYRDSYYIFYASKLTNHHRDAIRLSFFNTAIDETDFYDRQSYEKKLIPAYCGFMVLRPTFPKVIGRMAISPKAIKNNNFACCSTSLNATVLFDKFKSEAFPHSSQDGHTITCAETTIWGLLEYFSSQYPEYKPVLPSVISNIIKKISFKRTFPSEGLTAEQITYAIRELGFGSMIYARKRQETAFNGLVSTYIESGIPVIGVLRNTKGDIGHAVNIIGREIDDPQVVLTATPAEKTVHGGYLIDFNRIDRNYVFMDDNYPPYQLGKLDFPCQGYVLEEDLKEKWKDVNLTHIIAPLYPKIYLEAAVARKNFIKALNSHGLGEDMSITVTDTRILRIFLSSSRSFKQYISLDSGLPQKAKTFIVNAPMPKFIWLAEISTPDSFQKGQCDGVLVQDATEPGEYSAGKNQFIMHSLILGIYEKVIFRQDFGKFTTITGTFEGPFTSYRNNLNTVSHDTTA